MRIGNTTSMVKRTISVVNIEHRRTSVLKQRMFHRATSFPIMHEEAQQCMERFNDAPKKTTLIIKKGNEKATLAQISVVNKLFVSTENFLDEEDNIAVQKDVSSDCQCYQIAQDDNGTRKWVESTSRTPSMLLHPLCPEEQTWLTRPDLSGRKAVTSPQRWESQNDRGHSSNVYPNSTISINHHLSNRYRYAILKLRIYNNRTGRKNHLNVPTRSRLERVQGEIISNMNEVQGNGQEVFYVLLLCRSIFFPRLLLNSCSFCIFCYHWLIYSPSDICAALLIFKIPYYSATIRFCPTLTIKSTGTIAHNMEQGIEKRCRAHEPSVWWHVALFLPFFLVTIKNSLLNPSLEYTNTR